MKMLYNKNNLNVAKIASKDDTKPVIAGVLFLKNKTVATDSVRLLEITTPSDADVADFPLINDFPVLKNIEPFIVNAKQLSGIKFPSGKRLPILSNIAVKSVDDKTVELVTTDLEGANVKSFNKINEKFPDYEQLFPKDESVIEFDINAELLSGLLDAMAGINKKVHFKIYKDNLPIILSVENDNQKGRAMIMSIKC